MVSALVQAPKLAAGGDSSRPIDPEAAEARVLGRRLILFLLSPVMRKFTSQVGEDEDDLLELSTFVWFLDTFVVLANRLNADTYFWKNHRCAHPDVGLQVYPSMSRLLLAANTRFSTKNVR